MIAAKKKVLVIVPRMPYPLDGGGKYFTYETLKILNKNYSVYLVVINDAPISIAQNTAMEKVSKKYYGFTFPKWRFYFNVIKGFFKNESLQASYFYFDAVQKKVNTLLAEVDFCYLFINRTAKYCFDTEKPVVFNAIDSIYLSYSNSLNNTQSFFWNFIYKIEIKRLFKIEKHCVENFSCSFFVNVKEADFWKKYGNSFPISFGVDQYLFYYEKKSDEYKNVVAFFGRMDYQPNIDAVKWFCKNVLDKLDPALEFWIIGAEPIDEVRKLADLYPRVKVTGFVDDPYIIIRSAVCTVAPMQTGGGVQTKMLMAMAVESVVISSSLPMAGLSQAENGKHLIVEDNADLFAGRVNDIYVNPHLYTEMRQNARKLMKEKFNWEIVEENTIMYIKKYALKSLNNVLD